MSDEKVWRGWGYWVPADFRGKSVSIKRGWRGCTGSDVWLFNAPPVHVAPFEEATEAVVLPAADYDALLHELTTARTALAEKEADVTRLKAERGAQGFDRDFLGQIVRKAWVDWAREQPNPKLSWLVPWSELSEPDKEADRRIGEAVANISVSPELLKVEAENTRLRAECESLKKDGDNLEEQYAELKRKLDHQIAITTAEY